MFKVAGVSATKGQFKVRFANDMTRVKMLSKAGQTDIELIELPKAISKPEAVTFLKSTELYANAKFTAAIDAADAKYNGEKTVKVTKAKAKPSMEAIKARAAKPAKATEAAE
jgi:hypothetical protein